MNSIYKYCPVYSHDKPEDEYSLINLINNQVRFSRRNSFNDLFDSKVIIETPSRSCVRRMYTKLSGKQKIKFKSVYMGSSSLQRLEDLKNEMNKVLDGFLFYCVTENPVNNLMWSHYANSHNGFCIEWDKNEINADKVTYKNTLPTLHIIEYIESIWGLCSTTELAIKSWEALRVKLNEWEYEKEYRVRLSNEAKHLIRYDCEDFALVEFQPEWIKSIIFGYRMPEKTRQYIQTNLGEKIKYKEIVISRDQCSLEVREL